MPPSNWASSLFRNSGVVTIAMLVLGCNKLLAGAKHDESDAGATAANVAATAATPSGTPAASATAVAPLAVAAKNGAPGAPASSQGRDVSAGKKPLAAPSPTTDRFPRNRLKDGPCAAGFVEQPGTEEHSSCARSCKTESDCHGHTCIDSDVGDGKVCSNDPSKAKASTPVANLPKCKGEERLWTVEEHAKPFCATGESCSTDKDCKGKGTCTDALMVEEDGHLALSHNGTPLGMKMCKPK